MDEKEYEYIRLAAFVDGEGTIGVNRTTKTASGGSYRQYISVGNTDIRLIHWLVANFGGKVPLPMIDGNKNHKDGYVWNLTGKNSYKLIKKIRKHLLLKQEQADCAITLFEQVSKWHYCGNKPMPKHKRELAERLNKRTKELNYRGVQDDDEREDLKITISIKKKDMTWDDYETEMVEGEEEWNGD